MIFALIGILIGAIIGLLLPYTYNSTYSLYITVAILASLDSVFGGIRASLEERFDIQVFLSGFFGNSILATFLAYIGEMFGVPLYFASIFTFGGRIFDNFAYIRRLLLYKTNRYKQDNKQILDEGE
ncbi:MAG: small basic family protein [Tissierella sp.]|uniref:small basic family protein n=1 Tax=Tissierella sp. TaxID=41274 RepID=UPI003F9D01AD